MLSHKRWGRKHSFRVHTKPWFGQIGKMGIKYEFDQGELLGYFL